MSKCEHGLTIKECYVCMSPKHGEPAKKSEWVGLTTDERVELMQKVPHLTIGGLLAVEAKLKEKNT